MDFNIVVDLIQDELNDAEVEVRDLTGTRDHLEIEVKSSAFREKC